MKIVLAFDKFKGSATSQQLNYAVQQALSDYEGLSVISVPLADGGDGTTAVLASNMQGEWQSMSVPGPLISLPPVNASYFLGDDGTAVIEVAAASGLVLVPNELRDPFRMSTLGTGLLMRDAMERGSRHIVLGMGGSATCDAAMGILCALGVEFFDANGRHLFPCGANLKEIDHIETAGIPHEVKACKFTLLADVDNPLCGERGTAHVYAPQKGADPEQVRQLELGMCHVAEIVGETIATTPGCGAAGGIPSLMMHLLDCELLAGAPYVLDHNGMNDAVMHADLIITGEGRLDRQTMMGKGPGCVINMAHELGIPVAVICGAIEEDFDPKEAGLLTAVGVSDGLPLEEAMDSTSTIKRVSIAAQQIVSEFEQSQK
jgi:glycerate kinase